jgi:hypothetical protein
MKKVQPDQLIAQKRHARLVSVRDLLTVKDDLQGDLDRFLLEKENANRSPLVSKMAQDQNRLGVFMEENKDEQIDRFRNF